MDSISLYKSHTRAYFASSHHSPDIKYYDFQKLCDLENIGQGHDAQHLQWRHSIASTQLISDSTSNICSNSHHLRDIRKNYKMLNVLTLKMKDKGHGVEEQNLGHSTGIGDFFRVLATWKYTFTQKVTQIHTARDGGDEYMQNLLSRFA